MYSNIIWTREDFTVIKFHERMSLSDVLKDARDASLGSASVVKQTVVAREAGISQPQLSRIEMGDAELTNLKPKQILSVLQGYNLTRREILECGERFGLDLPYEYVNELPANLGAKVAMTGARVRDMGNISAGLKPGTEQTRYVSVPQELLDEFDAEEIFVLTVGSDDLVSEEVGSLFPRGTKLYFSDRIPPEEGDVVAYWHPKEKSGLVKMHSSLRPFTVVQAYSGAKPPVIINSRDDLIAMGVMIGESKMRARFRRMT